MSNELLRRLPSVPPLVHIVLTQAVRRRSESEITDAIFDEQIRRLIREELVPKGFALSVQKLPRGRTCLTITETSTGLVCDLKNFDAHGVLEPDSADPVEASPA